MMKNNKKKTENGVFKKSKSVITLPKKRTMGIDIGSKNIKIAVVKGDRLLSAVSEPIPNGVVVDGVIEAPDLLVKSLKKAKRKLKGALRKGTLCLSGKDLIMREITLPQMKEEQVLTNIKNELSNIYLLTSGDYTIDYRISEITNNTYTGEKSMRVLVVSAPKVLISDYMKVCKKAGIKLERIDVLPNAHTKLIRKIINDELKNDKNGLKEVSNKKYKSDKIPKAKLDKKNHKRLIKEKKNAKKEAANEALKRKRLLEEQAKLAREEAAEAERERLRAEKERAMAEAKLNAERAAKEALERKKKAEEEQRIAEEKRIAEERRNSAIQNENSDVKKISWYFGRKLNDLDENLYEEEPVKNTKTDPQEDMPCNFVLDVPLDLYTGTAEEYVEDKKKLHELAESLSEGVAEIINEDVKADLTAAEPVSAEIKEQIDEIDGSVQTDLSEEFHESHNYISDEEASNILDNFMNDTLKAKENKDNKENNNKEDKNILENVCLIDIGFTMSNVTFIRNGSYSMHKNIRYGGEYINEAISEKMSLDMNSAEDFKISKNDDKNGALYEYYDSIISELDNTMYYYKTNNNQNGVDCIVIAGGSSRLGGIKEYFSAQLGVPVYMLSEIMNYSIGNKLSKRQKGKELHIEDYLGAVSITIKEEWV